jgi:hypothetical protein
MSEPDLAALRAELAITQQALLALAQLVLAAAEGRRTPLEVRAAITRLEQQILRSGR